MGLWGSVGVRGESHRKQGLRQGQAGGGLPQASGVHASPGMRLAKDALAFPGQLCSHHRLYPWDPTAQVQPASKCKKNPPGGCSLPRAALCSSHSAAFVPLLFLARPSLPTWGNHSGPCGLLHPRAPTLALKTHCPLVVQTSLCVPTGGSRLSYTELFSRKPHPVPTGWGPRVGAREQGSAPPLHGAVTLSSIAAGPFGDICGGLFHVKGSRWRALPHWGGGWAGEGRLEAPTRPSKCSRLEAPDRPAHIHALNCNQYPEKQSILSRVVYWDKDSGEDYANTVQTRLRVQVPQMIRQPVSQLTGGSHRRPPKSPRPRRPAPWPASITFLLPPRAGAGSSVRTGVTVP